MGGDQDEDKMRLMWIVLGSVIGSTTISTGIQKVTTDARSDPFTGAEGRELTRRLYHLEREVAELPPDDWEKRIEVLEEHYHEMWQYLSDHAQEDATYHYRIRQVEKKLNLDGE